MATVKSFKQLHRLRLEAQPVLIQRAGSHVRARYHGHASFTFGQTAEEAVDRLRVGRYLYSAGHGKKRTKNGD